MKRREIPDKCWEGMPTCMRVCVCVKSLKFVKIKSFGAMELKEGILEHPSFLKGQENSFHQENSEQL